MSARGAALCAFAHPWERSYALHAVSDSVLRAQIAAQLPRTHRPLHGRRGRQPSSGGTAARLRLGTLPTRCGSLASIVAGRANRALPKTLARSDCPNLVAHGDG